MTTVKGLYEYKADLFYYTQELLCYIIYSINSKI